MAATFGGAVQLTTSGLILLPVLAMIAVLRWRWLVPATILLAPLASMSVLDVPSISFSLQPPAAASLLLLARATFAAARRPGSTLTRWQRSVITPFVLVVAWASFSAIALSRVFAGTPVRNADGKLVALVPSLLHVTQLGYLMMGIALIVAFRIAVTTVEQANAALRAIVASGWLAFVLGLVQMQIAGSTGWLSRFLFNNQGFLLLVDQRIDGQVRMASTLIEPSVAAVFFGGYTAYLLRLTLDRSPIVPRPVLLASLLIGVAGTLMTLATTGFVTLGVIVVATTLTSLRHRRGADLAATVVVCLSVMIILTAAALRLDLISTTDGPWTDVVSTITTEKADSTSAQQRLEGEQLAMEGFERSYGLGLGWGSSRAFSLASTVLANLGVPGAVLTLWCANRLRRSIRSLRNAARRERIRELSTLAGAARALGRRVDRELRSRCVLVPRHRLRVLVAAARASGRDLRGRRTPRGRLSSGATP